MPDARLNSLARLLVGYSVAVQPGDAVVLTGPLPAAPLLTLLHNAVREAGGTPVPGQDLTELDAADACIFVEADLGARAFPIPPPAAWDGGTYEEQMELAADGLRRLTEFAAPMEMNVIVENHGGLSSNGAWLAATIKKANHPRCGTLPDFGNFRVSKDQEYDRYKGVAELMPFAKGVSAKSHDFDEKGNEVHTDYRRMMKIVLDAGYKGYVGIEYEGSKLSEPDGIRATKKLLERVRNELA